MSCHFANMKLFFLNPVCRLCRQFDAGWLSRRIHSNKKNFRIKLHKIGTAQEPNVLSEPYPPGTLFLHKIFPYRGIVIQSWEANVHYTKEQSELVDSLISKDTEMETSESDESSAEKMSTRKQFCYKILPDMRDVAHVNIESLPFKGDFVLHEDILPYYGSELKPIQNPVFNTVFLQDPINETNFILRDNIGPLSNAVLPTDVYREITEKVRVTVTPLKWMWKYQHYTKQHMWQYFIRLENLGSTTVTLRERVWKIADKENVLVTVKGKGVVGKEPVLSRKNPAFQYSSFCTLESSSGWMWGKFIMEHEDGSKFECKIPKFQLKGKEEDLEGSDPSTET